VNKLISPAFFVLLIVVAVGSAPGAPTQELQPADADQVITIDVDLVNVLFTVSDDDDELLTDLAETDFRVFEDGVEQTIFSFDAETELPLTIALIIDVSGSIRDKLRFEQEAAIEFFYTTIEEDRDQAMLVTFDSAVDLLQDFTDNPESLSEAVSRIRAGGGTALYNAIFLSVNEITKQTRDGRRVVIVISDGDDNASRVSLTETLELAQRNDVVIYTISTNATANFLSPEQRRGDRTLETFADETGGRAFFPFKLEELAVNFADITQELRSQYTLGYVPTNLTRDGSYREIRVETLDDDFEVKHREGYYAPVSGAPEE
jgi:Ca-activated chloride channel family protein